MVNFLTPRRPLSEMDNRAVPHKILNDGWKESKPEFDGDDSQTFAAELTVEREYDTISVIDRKE